MLWHGRRVLGRRQTRAPAGALISRRAGSLDDIKASSFVIRYFSLVISYFKNVQYILVIHPPAVFQYVRPSEKITSIIANL